MDNEITALTVIFTEFYYWVTVVLMFLIHGFLCMRLGYRGKNHLHTLMKNTILIPLVSVTFFIWMVDLLGLPNGPGITGDLV